uniref:Uncharacterized protein n=1 Tax=viral metagenome TaxID=1070528 RepID=A0A6H1Z860_9ZZZZ
MIFEFQCGSQAILDRIVPHIRMKIEISPQELESLQYVDMELRNQLVATIKKKINEP